jgi:hypothetical protein
LEESIPVDYIKSVIEEKIPLHVEQFFRDFFSKVYGLKPVKINSPEIDVALVKFNKLILVCEVKWKNKLKNSDIENTIKKFEEFVCEKFFITKNIDENQKEKLENYGIKVLTERDFIDQKIIPLNQVI